MFEKRRVFRPIEITKGSRLAAIIDSADHDNMRFALHCSLFITCALPVFSLPLICLLSLLAGGFSWTMWHEMLEGILVLWSVGVFVSIAVGFGQELSERLGGLEGRELQAAKDLSSVIKNWGRCYATVRGMDPTDLGELGGELLELINLLERDITSAQRSLDNGSVWLTHQRDLMSKLPWYTERFKELEPRVNKLNRKLLDEGMAQFDILDCDTARQREAVLVVEERH